MMKTFFTCGLASIVILSVSCKKNTLVGSSVDVTGSWSILSDSTWSSGIGPNGTPSSNKYNGVAGDHFIFTGNQLYIKQGPLKLDTAAYIIAKDTLKLSYEYLNNGGVLITGGHWSYIIVPIDQQNMELKSNAITPGGIINEYIYLIRASQTGPSTL